jgi:ribosome maturation factor RimP
MENMVSDSDLENIITPLLGSLGLNLVEFSVGRHRGDVKINLVLYKIGGIGLDDLAKAQKILRPRLELEIDRGNLSVEISSPGLSRTIKSQSEYRIFAGRTIRLLVDEDWIEGTLMGSDDLSVKIITDQEERSIPLAKIRKARLD